MGIIPLIPPTRGDPDRRNHSKKRRRTKEPLQRRAHKDENINSNILVCTEDDLERLLLPLVPDRKDVQRVIKRLFPYLQGLPTTLSELKQWVPHKDMQRGEGSNKSLEGSTTAVARAKPRLVPNVYVKFRSFRSFEAYCKKKLCMNDTTDIRGLYKPTPFRVGTMVAYAKSCGCAPIITTERKKLKIPKRKSVVLCIGMKKVEGVPVTPTALRDMARIKRLEGMGYGVYTMSKNEGEKGACTHVASKVGRRGGSSTGSVVGEQLIRYICMDFVRFPTGYFDDVFLNYNQPGKPLVDMLTVLRDEGYLVEGCEVFVPARQSEGFDKAVKLFEKHLGTVSFVSPVASPLYKASLQADCGNHDAEKDFKNLAPSGKMCRIRIA